MSRGMSFVKRRIPTGMGKLTSGSITTKTARWNGSKRTLILMESRILGFFTREENQNDRRSLATKTVELMHGFISMKREKSSVRGRYQGRWEASPLGVPSEPSAPPERRGY